MYLRIQNSVWVLAVAVAALFFTSCGSETPKHALVIPNDASAVMTANMSNMALKADVPAFKQTDMWKQIESEIERMLKFAPKDAAEAAREAIDDPTVTGIDWLEDMYMFTHGEEELIYTAMSMKMADQAKFETFLGKMPLADAKEDEGGFKYINPEDEVVVAWNEGMLLCLIVDSWEHREEALGYVKDLMKADETKSFVKNEQFAAFLETKKDFGVFVDWKLAKEAMPYYMRRDMEGEEWDVINGNYTSMTVEFSDDKISVGIENLFTDAFKSRFDVMSPDGVPSDYKNLVTDNGQLVGFASLAINMDGIIKIVENEGDISKELDRMVDELNLKRSDVFNMFTGDIAYSFMDIEEKEVTFDLGDFGMEGAEVDMEPYTQKMPVPKTMTIIGLNEKETLEKIFQDQDMKKTDGYYNIYGTQFFVLLDDKLVMTSHEELAKKVAETGELGTFKNGYESLMEDNPIAAYLSLNWDEYPEMIREGAEMMMNRSERKLLNSVMTKFDAVTLSGTWFSSKIEVKMADPSQNSLKTLLGIVQEAS